jgi:hypothetical protein
MRYSWRLKGVSRERDIEMVVSWYYVQNGRKLDGHLLSWPFSKSEDTAETSVQC